MIFVLAKHEPKLFLMLSEKEDMADLRAGLTKFVDEHQLSGARFTGVIVSLGKSDKENLKLLRSVHPDLDAHPFAVPAPTANEVQCEGCAGIMRPEQLNQGRCIVCWRNLAIRLMGEAN